MNTHNLNRPRFWHRIRENKTARLPTRFVVVDTETKSSAIDETHTANALWFGCATYWDSPNDNKHVPHREQISFTTAGEFWDFVESHAKPHTRLIFSAHNLAFDFMVLDGIGELTRRGWKIEYPITAGLRFISTARRDSATILFVDTLNFCPTTLAELGDSLGLAKKRMPSADAPLAKWIEYCRRDVEIVEYFWRQLINFLRDNDYGSFGVTAAALALKIYRHRFLETPIVIHTVKHATELERSAFLGGRNECYRVGKPPRSTYYLLDVNSLYPSVMAEHQFPCLFVSSRRSCSIAALRKLMQRYFVIARVGLDTDEPAYPVKMKNRLVFPVGRFETVLCGAELEHALAADRVRYVRDVACYRKAVLFEKYVKSLYSQRLDYKRANNPAFALFCKMLLNSLYGKFGQRGHVREELHCKAPARYGSERMYSEKMSREMFVTYWDGKGFIEYQDGEAFDSFPAIAAAATSFGRMKMWQLQQRAGRENVLYCDTDALIVNEDGYKNLADEIDPDRLGALKLERVCHKLELWGKKDYRLDAIVRMKGIKRTATRLDGGIYEQDRFETLREAVRQGRTSGVVSVRERKEVSRLYDAGLVGADGTVSPISLSVF